MSGNVSVGQFLVKACELVDIVINALLFHIRAAALNAFDDVLFGEELQGLTHRHTADVKGLLSDDSVGSASPGFSSPLAIFTQHVGYLPGIGFTAHSD